MRTGTYWGGWWEGDFLRKADGGQGVPEEGTALVPMSEESKGAGNGHLYSQVTCKSNFL